MDDGSTFPCRQLEFYRWGLRWAGDAARWMARPSAWGGGAGKSAPPTPKHDGERAPPAKFATPHRLEKPLGIQLATVPKPTQVEGYQYTKARESNLVKELGNIAP